MKVLSTVRKELFDSFSRIKIDPAVEGCKIKEGNLVLGCKAGPSQEMSNLFHEMGHMIQSPDNRIGLPSWGLDYKWVDIPPYQSYPEILTCKDVLLEIDVIGWQAVIEQHFTGSIRCALDNARSLRFLGGWAYYEYDTVRRLNLDYNSGEAMRIHLAQEHVKTLVFQRSYEQFLEEWKRKCSLLGTKIIFEEEGVH